jgi:SAM-dependent methyltransferase
MNAPGARYDEIGVGYARHRRPDPRIAAALAEALGDAATVVNVGAGTGSYEPAERQVVAVEPSWEMIAQRPPGAAPVVQATAEALPFRDEGFDAAIALLSLHHWADWRAGLRELRRVARRQVVWTFDAAVHNDMWLFREYFPGAVHVPGTGDTPSVDEVAAVLGGGSRVETLLIPADCSDLFGAASWRRPEHYLDDEICAAASALAQLPAGEVREGQRRLAADLRSGRWHENHADLLALDAYDGGLRLVLGEA